MSDKDILDSAKEPQVIKEVLKEVKQLGADSKEAYTVMAREVEELKSTLDKAEKSFDPLVTEKVEKLLDAVTIRQGEMDKAAGERIDKLEVALKRAPREGIEEGAVSKLSEQARQFKMAELGLAGRLTSKGVSPEEVDVEGFKAYKNAFPKYLRKGEQPGHGIMTAEDCKAMLVGSDPDGGYLVTPEISNRVIERIREIDPMRGLAGQQTISTDSIEISVDFDDLTANWVGEQDSRPETDTPEWGRKKIFTHEIYAQPKATQKLLEDAAIDPEMWLAKKLGDRFGRSEASSFIDGDGVAKPRGILSYPTTTSSNSVEIGKIEQVALGAVATLTTDGYMDLMYSLEEVYLFRGTWLMNRLAVRDTMKLKDGDGNYIWRVGLQAGQPLSVLNVPVRMSPTMPVVAANALSIALADWSEAYLIVDRLGMTTLRDPYTNKPNVLFYTRKRVGGDVVNFSAIKIGKVSV